MFDLDLTEEHRLLEQTVREWAAREVAPHIAELDRAHKFDPRILPQMADLGLLGVSVPVEYGGAGMDYISLGVASEELEYVDTSLRVILSVHVGLNSLSLLSWGTEDQKQRYLVPQAQGKKIATFGLTEPAAGSDARGIQTVAVKQGDRYVLSGEKMWISLADVADNFLVIAWSDMEKKRAKDPSGLSAFIVERSFKGFSSANIAILKPSPSRPRRFSAGTSTSSILKKPVLPARMPHLWVSVPLENPLKLRSTMKALSPLGSLARFFSMSLHAITRKLSATSAREIHIFSPDKT